METKIEELPLAPLFEARNEGELYEAARKVNDFLSDTRDPEVKILSFKVNEVTLSEVKQVYCMPFLSRYASMSPADLLLLGAGKVELTRAMMADKKLEKVSVVDDGKLMAVTLSIEF